MVGQAHDAQGVDQLAGRSEVAQAQPGHAEGLAHGAGHRQVRVAGPGGVGLGEQLQGAGHAGAAELAVGLVDDDDSARALWRDAHEHRVRVGVSAEVTQEEIALRDGRRDKQVVVEGLRGPCSYLRE